MNGVVGVNAVLVVEVFAGSIGAEEEEEADEATGAALKTFAGHPEPPPSDRRVNTIVLASSVNVARSGEVRPSTFKCS